MKFNNRAGKLALWDKREEGYCIAAGLPPVENSPASVECQKEESKKQAKRGGKQAVPYAISASAS